MVNENGDIRPFRIMHSPYALANALADRQRQASRALESRRAIAVRRPMRHIGVSLRRALRPVKGHIRGSIAALEFHWADIVGDKLAQLSRPERLIPDKTGTVLVIRGESAATALIHHASPAICERASLICGTGIVRLSFRHGTAQADSSAILRHSPLQKTHDLLADTVPSVKNERVRESLAKLESLVMGASGNQPDRTKTGRRP